MVSLSSLNPDGTALGDPYLFSAASLGDLDPNLKVPYLDEFTFRHNRRKSRHVGKIFYRMLQGAVGTQATPYWQLVNRSAPDEPLHMGSPLA